MKDVAYNVKVPDEIFSFKTMDGLEGRIVQGGTNGDLYRYVNGVMHNFDEYERATRAKQDPQPAPEPVAVGKAPAGRLTWYYAAAAAICAAVAVLFLRRALRR